MNMLLRSGEKMKMKMIKDYYDLYLKCDALLLADGFEKFRNNSLILAEKDTRSGVSFISNRYSKASNKYLKSCEFSKLCSQS